MAFDEQRRCWREDSRSAVLFVRACGSFVICYFLRLNYACNRVPYQHRVRTVSNALKERRSQAAASFQGAAQLLLLDRLVSRQL